jgi:hypothetical protein
MRHPNCLASFFGRDSNSCVALVARKYGRSAGVSRAVSARFSEGGSIRVLFSSHFVVPGRGSDTDYGQWDNRAGRVNVDV